MEKATLLIRNTHGGMIWQVYHVETEEEVAILSRNSLRNGFVSRELVPYVEGEFKETWPGWRDTDGWKSQLAEYRENH